MKKVLSVLLAAAMACGMSVASFADVVWGTAANAGDSEYKANELYFAEYMVIEHEDGTFVDDAAWDTKDSHTIIAGDTLYFPILVEHEHTIDCCVEVGHNSLSAEAHALKTDCDYSECEIGFDYYNGEIDAAWVINVKDVDYVSNAYFTADTATGFSTKMNNKVGYDKYLAIEVDADYDEIDADDIDFYAYIAQKDEDTHRTVKSEMIEVHYVFDNWDKAQNVEFIVDYDFVNEVDVPAKWISEDKGTAFFSFDDDAFFEVKMVVDEEVVLNPEIKNYVKEIEKAFDYEADYVSYNFKGTKDEFYREGVLVLPADEDTFVYAWDGEFAEIEAEYVEDYKFDNGKKVDGWMIKTNELGWYVVSDLEAEIEVEAEVEAPVEAEKANPETGAADFVGAAVAMAVVSVAAAGALALKK